MVRECPNGFSRVHAWGNELCRLSWLINPLLNVESTRWVLERLFGVSRRRKLPPFARRPFLKSAPRHWLAPPVSLRDPSPVIYFVDHFANYHDPELAFAFGRIVEHHGRTLHVPPGQLRSGMALISTGDLDAARPLVEKNVRLLAEFAREGCTIVCTEPATVACLKQEYPRVLDHPDVQTIADRVVDAGDFLVHAHKRRVANGFLAAQFECHLSHAVSFANAASGTIAVSFVPIDSAFENVVR